MCGKYQLLTWLFTQIKKFSYVWNNLLNDRHVMHPFSHFRNRTNGAHLNKWMLRLWGNNGCSMYGMVENNILPCDPWLTKWRKRTPKMNYQHGNIVEKHYLVNDMHQILLFMTFYFREHANWTWIGQSTRMYMRWMVTIWWLIGDTYMMNGGHGIIW